MPPIFSALRSRSFSGIRQAPWLVTAEGETLAGEGVAVGVVVPPAEVGPGVDPGPALWSLVYMSTDSVTVVVGSENLNVLLAQEIAELAAASIGNMYRHVDLMLRVMALEAK